jgi:hypothetical protein
VIVAVCGASVPEVSDVLDVELGEEGAVVEGAVVAVGELVVVAEFEVDGLLEQAARARAQAGRISRRMDHVRNAPGMAGVYDGAVGKWGFPEVTVRQERAGTVPITDARSIERRCGQ